MEVELLLLRLDPEVRIALENLQQFPAFSACSGEPAGPENQSHLLPPCVGGSPTSQSGKQPKQFQPSTASSKAAFLDLGNFKDGQSSTSRIPQPTTLGVEVLNFAMALKRLM